MATAPKPDPQRAAFERAFAVAGRIVGRLTTLPRSVEVDTDVITRTPRIKIFSGHNPGPVLEFASIADVTVTKGQNESRSSWFVEAKAPVEGVEVWAWALLSNSQAKRLAERTTPTPAPVSVQPLGSAVVARVAAVVTDTEAAQ